MIAGYHELRWISGEIWDSQIFLDDTISGKQIVAKCNQKNAQNFAKTRFF